MKEQQRKEVNHAGSKIWIKHKLIYIGSSHPWGCCHCAIQETLDMQSEECMEGGGIHINGERGCDKEWRCPRGSDVEKYTLC